MIKGNQKVINRLVIIWDILSFALAFFTAWYLRMGSRFIPPNVGTLSFNQYITPIMIMLPIYLMIYYYVGLYDFNSINGINNQFLVIIKANLYGVIILTLLLFILKTMHYSRVLLFIFAFFNAIYSVIERGLIRNFLKSKKNKTNGEKNILFIGGTYLIKEFTSRLKKNAQWSYNIHGIVDDDSPINSTIYDIPVIGSLENLETILNDNFIDEIYITINMKDYHKLKEIIAICEKYGIRTQIIPGYHKYIPAKPYVEDLDGLPIINIRYVPLDNVLNKYIKRTFDIIMSSIAIILSSPIMLTAFLAIKITSPGPVIFKQERVGLNNRTFTMYKFRSMKLQKEDEEKSEWTTKNDPRKTKVGNFIRKTSIDELPQFFNVLMGDMSIVGPRPERPFFVDKFKEEIPKYMVKHQVRPGITGWAQVNGYRGDTSIEKRIEHDIYYIEHWTLLFDIKIMFLTVFKGLVNKNAY